MNIISELVALAVKNYKSCDNGKKVYFLHYATKAAEAIVATFFDLKSMKEAALCVLNDGGMVFEIIEEDRRA